MSAQDRWILDIQERVAKRQIALVCGTGVSASISGNQKGAQWRDLLLIGLDDVGSIDAAAKGHAAVLAASLNASADVDSLITAAEWLQRKFKKQPGEYRDFLRRTVGQLVAHDHSMATICDSDIPILTTNYDDLIEKISGRTPVSWTDEARIADYHDDRGRYVFHIHGYFDDPDSVVLSAADYTRLELAKPVSKILEPIAATHALLLVGYGQGLTDPNFDSFLTWYTNNFGESTRRIYLLVLDEDIPDKALDGKVAYIGYGKRHEDLPAKLCELLLSKDDTQSENVETTQSKVVSTSVGVAASRKRERPRISAEGQLEPDDDPHPLGSFEESMLPALRGLPPSVVEEVGRQLPNFDDLEQFQTTVLDSGATELQSGAPVLLSAVTGTGKTTLSRILMNGSIARRCSAVMVLPTKALVSQELREWDRWQRAWQDGERRIRVYGASRDYPENDSPVAKGRFEIALAIYEKLAGYLVAGGSTLSHAELVVVDELQTLVEDKERALKLERLLTMIRLIPREQRPAILGLSATLGAASTDVLRKWLGVRESGFIRTVDRSVPLDTIIVDQTTWRKQPDAHVAALDSLPAGGLEPYKEDRHSLSEKWLDGVAPSKTHVHKLLTAPLAIAIVAELLVNDLDRRVIVFVPGRTAAQDLALAIQRLLDKHLGAPSRGKNPWLDGRFAKPGLDPDLADEQLTSLKYSDLPDWDQVLRGLRHGVAFHSARLAPRLRTTLEDEFRSQSGLLRVLVATDTLAQGVNLPADAVIATSLSSFGNDRQRRIATAAELDNKAGRAGRRGQTERKRGEFYLIVPGPKDLEDVNDLTADSAKNLCTIAGVYDRYVASANRTPNVVGRIYDTDDVALLALHVLSADGFKRTRTSLEARVESIIDALLASHEKRAPLPSADQIISRLENLQLLSEINGKTKPSILGFALSRSALGLQSASILERLARIAIAGAGDIDILFNACRSSEIEGVTAWVGLPSVPRHHYPSLKEAILTYALAYIHENRERRTWCSQLISNAGYPLASRLVVDGQSVVSKELKKLLEADSEAIEDRDATALLRALVAFEWSRGIPFKEIKARFSSAIRSDEQRPGGRPVELKLHYSDVEQLCEQVAGVIRGSVDISFGEKLDWSNRMRMLALQTEVGLPAWLAPIAKMRIDCLHRNRLSMLWDQQPPDETWAAILDMKPLADHAGISDRAREDARAQLENRQREADTLKHLVSQEWAAEFVPGLDGVTFEEFGEDLTSAATDEYVDLLCEMAVQIGIHVEPGQELDGFVTRMWRSDDKSILLMVPSNEIGAEEVRSVRDEDAIVVLRTRLRPSSYEEFASVGSAVRFLAPEVLLEMIARLRQTRGEALLPDEVIARLSSVRVSALDSESLAAVVEAGQAPPPFEGTMPALNSTAADPTLVLSAEADVP